MNEYLTVCPCFWLYRKYCPHFSSTASLLPTFRDSQDISAPPPGDHTWQPSHLSVTVAEVSHQVLWLRMVRAHPARHCKPLTWTTPDASLNLHGLLPSPVRFVKFIFLPEYFLQSIKLLKNSDVHQLNLDVQTTIGSCLSIFFFCIFTSPIPQLSPLFTDTVLGPFWRCVLHFECPQLRCGSKFVLGPFAKFQVHQGA